MRVRQDLRLQLKVLDLTLQLGILTLRRHWRSSETFCPASSVLPGCLSSCSGSPLLVAFTGHPSYHHRGCSSDLPGSQDHLPFLLPSPVPAGPLGIPAAWPLAGCTGLRASFTACFTTGGPASPSSAAPSLLSHRPEVGSLWTSCPGASSHAAGSPADLLLCGSWIFLAPSLTVSWELKEAGFSMVFQKVCGVLREALLRCLPRADRWGAVTAQAWQHLRSLGLCPSLPVLAAFSMAPWRAGRLSLGHPPLPKEHGLLAVEPIRAGSWQLPGTL